MKQAIARQIIEVSQRGEKLYGSNAVRSRTYSDLDWLAVLLEEVGEVGSELKPKVEFSAERLEEELVQVAAVAVSWIEALKKGVKCTND